MDKQFYFPWVRKGLGAFIDEKETRGADGAILCRPELTVKSTYTARHNQPKEGEEAETSGVVLEKTVKFVGPGDILKINPSAVMKVHPEEGSEGFPYDYLPYIEFWEPDFLWRYTPASADEAQLRPWLALVTIRKEDLREFNPGEGLPYFSVDEKAWNAIFPSVEDLVCSAHAQGRDKNRPDFSRLLGMRKEKELEEGTEYVALLIPAYETGRLRGLGLDEEDIQDIPAQRPSWDTSFSKQKNRKRGTEFPIYFKWSFKTGKESFDAIASRLEPTGVNKSGLVLDVTDMGEGFSYNTVKHDKARTSITMPAATKTIDFKEEPAFPAESMRKWADEGLLYTNLKALLGKSPVFIENQADIAGVAISEQDSEDPWVVPPVYGARHAMSTQLDDKGKPWLKELNMDVHHRAAAGLGRKVVQQHQEELMDRAWKQVEAVQALNNELYQRLLSIQANRALRGKTVDQFTDPDDNTKYVEYMMRYLSSMKNAGSAKYNLSSILKKAGIPESFASPSFHNNAERLARIVEGMDTTTLMDQIVKDLIFQFTQQEPVGVFDYKKIERWCAFGDQAIVNEVYKKYWRSLFSVKYGAQECEDKSLSCSISSVSLKKIKFDIPATPSDDSDTLTVSVCQPYKFFLDYLNTRFKSYDRPLNTTGIYNVTQQSFIDFNPDNYRFYPRVYVVDDDVSKIFFQGRDLDISEGVKNLSLKIDGKKYSYECRALCIPAHLHQREFGLSKTIASFKNAPYEFTSLEKLYNSAISWWTAYSVPGMTYYGLIPPRSRFLCDNCKIEINTSTKLQLDRVMQISMFMNPVFYSDDGKLNKILASLVNKCRVAGDNDFYDNFKRDVKYIYNEKTDSGKYYFPYPSQVKRDVFLRDLTSVLDGNVTNKDLSKVPAYSKIEFISAILYTLLKHPSVLNAFVKDAFDGKMALTILCYMDWIGPYTLQKLASRLANINIGQENWDALVKMNDFLMASPSFVVLSKSEYDTLLRQKDVTPEDCLKQGMQSFYADELKYLSELRKLATELRIVQKIPQEIPAAKPIDDKAVVNLQKEVENEDAYEQMRRIALAYYQQFFADDDEGARLRDEYLNDLLRSKYPILAYPIFPEPTYYYLNMLSNKFIIPGLDEIPMDHIAMFNSNPTFTEAYLCGMNTEMGAELQWREYPTDRRGSYFRKFWDSESSVEAIRNDSFFDINPVHLWGKTKLGGNHLDGKGNLLIFAIHSELFKLYPGTRVYLNKANSKLGFGRGRIDPVMETFVREDIFLVGFKNVEVADVIGNPQSNDYGYLLAFEQDLDDLNFFQTAEDVDNKDSAAVRAEKLQDKVTIYGKHVSRFVIV